MTLFIIGIGLCDVEDISVKGLNTLRSCDTVFLEHYTSILSSSKEELEDFYQKPVTLAPRTLVEGEAEENILLPAKEKDIALLIVGDVFGATTHTDLQLRAKELGVTCEVIFNASILSAVGIVGLELYKYGKTTSIVFPDDGWLPHTPYGVIKQNKAVGLHTLCLLDIKVAEPNREDLLKGKTTPQPPRFMTVAQGIDVLLAIENERGENVLTPKTLAVGVARLGHKDFKVITGSLQELREKNFGSPLHSLIISGKLSVVEEEALSCWD